MLLIVEEISVDKSFPSWRLSLFTSEMGGGGNCLILLPHAHERGLTRTARSASPEIEAPQNLPGWEAPYVYPCACKAAWVWLEAAQACKVGLLSALPGLIRSGLATARPVEQRGFENKAGVWDVGPSSGRRAPPRGQRAWVGRAATANTCQKFSCSGDTI